MGHHGRLTRRYVRRLKISKIINEPRAIIITNMLRSGHNLPKLNNLNRVSRGLANRLMRLIVKEDHIGHNSLLLVLNKRILSSLIREFTNSKSLNNHSALILISHRITSLMIGTLGVNLNMLLKVSARLLRLITQDLLRAERRIITAILSLIGLHHGVLNSRLLGQEASATKGRSRTYGRSNRRKHGRRLLFRIIPPGRQRHTSQAQRALWWMDPCCPLVGALNGTGTQSIHFDIQAIYGPTRHTVGHFPAIRWGE